MSLTDAMSVVKSSLSYVQNPYSCKITRLKNFSIVLLKLYDWQKLHIYCSYQKKNGHEL
jgi:hypothetical protein